MLEIWIKDYFIEDYIEISWAYSSKDNNLIKQAILYVINEINTGFAVRKEDRLIQYYDENSKVIIVGKKARVDKAAQIFNNDFKHLQ